MSGFGTNGGYVPPPFYNFRPFFTIQPVQATREKQLKLWRDLIVSYHVHHKSFRMVDPPNWPLFKNDAIGRKLSTDAVKLVIDSLVEEGVAEWEDEDHPVNLIVMSKSSATLAHELYAWATKESLVGYIVTIYEIHAGDDYVDSPFQGMDPVILRKALEVLEAGGKAVVIQGEKPEDDGIKFT
jgi:ESCRT-II complex subunit VPS25